LYVVDDNYRVDPTGASNCGPGGPACYRVSTLPTRRVRPVNNGKSGPSISFADRSETGVVVDAAAELAVVSFVPVLGGGTTNPKVMNPGTASTRPP